MIKNLLLFFLISSLTLSAQQSIDFKQYKRLECQGEIPSEFKVRLDQYLNKSSYNDTNELKQLVQDFSNISLKKLLYSGLVLYGDPLSNYINQVADKALSGDKNLRSKLHFYVFKSEQVNAFTLANGNIFVTMGLLAKIEEENQLALVICHEAIHYKNNHLYLEEKKHNLLKERYGKAFTEFKFSKILNYSKELETEADVEGFKLLLKSEYITKGVEKFFESMLFSQYPFSNLEFKTNYFDQESYSLPSRYFLNQCKKISKSQLDNHPLSDHPNAISRQDRVTRLNESSEKTNGISYCISKDHFEYIKKIARFELPEIQLINGDFIGSMYSVYLIENLYGSSEFIDKIKGQILYVSAKTKSVELIKDFESKKLLSDTFGSTWQREAGNIQSLYYFFNTISAKELNVLAMRHLYSLYLKHMDSFYLTRVHDLCYDIQKQYKLYKKDFVLDNNNNIDNKNDINFVGNELEYYNFAFFSLQNDKLLKSIFNYEYDKIELENQKLSNTNYIAYKENKGKILDKFGPALNLKEITMLKPNASLFRFNYVYFDSFYYQIPVRDDNFSLVDEQALVNRFENMLNLYAKENGVKIHYLDLASIEHFNTDSFNQFSSLMATTQEINSYKNPTIIPYFNVQNSTFFNSNTVLGKLKVDIAYNNTRVNFKLIDVSKGSEIYHYEKELENCDQDNVKTRALLYEIIDHISQSPDKINQLKLKYNINE